MNMKYYVKQLRNRLLGSNVIISEIHQKIENEKNSLIFDMNYFIENNSKIMAKEIEGVMISKLDTDRQHIENKRIEFKYIKGEKLNVVFFVQHATVWNSLKSVYESMRHNQMINVSVVLLPFVHNDASVSKTYYDLKDFFIKENIPFINYNFYSLEAHRPHIVFVQNPYEETRPERFQITEIVKCGAKICYIPYGLDVSGGFWNIQSQFNLDIHKYAWKIFARSNRQKIMYAKYCDAGSSHVIVTGHPKFDNQKLVNQVKNEKILKKINGRKVILWTPHFSVENPPTWSTYHIYQKTIFDEFNKREDLFLYIRPHPLFFKAMINHGIWSEEDEIKFRNMIENSHNMALDESADYLQSFSISHALMADSGSFLLEYLPSLKPILYLHHPEGLGLYDETLEELYYKAVNEQNIIDFIDMISKGKDPELEKREKAIPDYLFGLDENIGGKIVDHIIDAFDKGDFYTPTLVDNDTLQKQSIAYLQNASNSFLAPDEYYASKEKILEAVCESIKFNGNAIDIGCGNGTFTFLLAKYLKEIDAYDASYSMICQAKYEQNLNNFNNIDFFHAELKDMKPFKRYNLVSCMGVTSTMPDDLEFLKILKSFKMLVKEEGYLLLIDSLSLTKEQVYNDESGYVAKYRNISDYKYLVHKTGFDLVEEHTIKVVTEKELTNNLLIFKNKKSY